MSNDLQHWGIKGMKWGVRRYQNADGSLTPAGVKRYRNEAGDIERKLAKGSKNDEDTIERYENSLRKIKTASTALEGVRRVKGEMDANNESSNRSRSEKRIRSEANEMSDYELAKQVQRMNMEENYTRLMMNKERINQGESYTNKFMDTVSTALKGATTALTIAIMIKELKGKNDEKRV